MHPTDEQVVQYQLLQPEVARFIVPSYASHVILENTPNKEVAAKTTVKIYRLQHNTMQIDDFINWKHLPDTNINPYYPTTYRPFFMGEFDALGNMIDPQEPMLYWVVPITAREGGVPPGDPTKRHLPGLDVLPRPWAGSTWSGDHGGSTGRPAFQGTRVRLGPHAVTPSGNEPRLRLEPWVQNFDVPLSLVNVLAPLAHPE